MADLKLTLDDALIPEFTNATLTDLVPAWQSAAGKLTLAKILALVIGSATSGFDTLGKIEGASLHVDGSNAMTSDLPMGGNWIDNLAFPGILTRAPQKVVTTTVSPDWAYHSKTRYAINILGGGGGAGGGTENTASTEAGAGAGGSAGAIAVFLIDVESLSTKEAAITIGAAGTGAAASNGGAGGSSQYNDGTTSIVCGGGPGGQERGPNTILTGGPGTAITLATVTGDVAACLLQIDGNAGFPCLLAAESLISGESFAMAGAGANSWFGVGGNGMSVESTTSGGVLGNNGTGYCSGGGGAISHKGGVARAGGYGRPGVFISLEFA